MKKTLICNGCSFMAGDEIVWEQFCQTNNIERSDYRTIPLKDSAMYNNYMEYRSTCNLPMQISKKLSMNRIDVSSDGNSNDMISINTINYILSLSKEERKNYHVLVGWTSNTRRMRFFTKNLAFINLTIHHLTNANPNMSIFKNYIKSSILEAENEDHYINYIKNLMLLENFLISNNMTYTFYRALGSVNDGVVKSHNFQPQWTGSFRDKEISNPNCWVKFDTNDNYPHIGSSWTQEILDKDPSNFVSVENLHPNLKAVEHVATIISKSIEAQGEL